MCGDDLRTHDNACMAACAGVGIVDDDPCERPCSVEIGCDAGEYCDVGPACGATGVCRPLLDPACDGDVDPPPVCACGGRTFPSACFAGANGVSVAHEGECECNDDPHEPNNDVESAYVFPVDSGAGDENGYY